ncbi:MAG: hypothetical protein AAF125_04410, partial [Chloroflexota bacterium]
SHPQTEWLDIDYDLTPANFITIYGIGLIVLAIIVAWEPSVRHELRESGALPMMVFVAAAANSIAAWQLVADQAHRFARPVPALSLLMAWGVALGVGAVLLALKEPSASPSRRMRRYLWTLALVVLSGMLYVHIGSTPHFNRLNDVYDEVWAASAIANYATNGDFSPSLGGSPYGSPDPLFSRWLLWNGMFARIVGSTDFATLRAFPTLAGVVLVAVTAVGLWRQPTLTPLARVMALAVLVSLTVFGRTAHNLRMDIGLGIYGALLWFTLLEAVNHPKRARWLLLVAGAVLYLGLETIPTVAVVVAFFAGLWVVWRAFRRPLVESHFGEVLVYLGGCVFAALGYILVHFAPDFATQWANFQLAQNTYVVMGSVSSGSPVIPLASTHRFSFVLSPIELFAVYAALFGLAWRGTAAERGLLVAVGAAQLTIHSVLGGSFGYQMVFVPFAVYAAARALHGRAAWIIAGFVLLPVMAAAPLNDMLMDWRLRINERAIAELDLLTWRVPEGGTVVGDDLFWLTLHDRADFLGHSALIHYRAGNALTNEQMLGHIAPDMVVCKPDVPDQAGLCELAAVHFETPPETFEITNGTYLVFTAP